MKKCTVCGDVELGQGVQNKGKCMRCGGTMVVIND